MYHHSSHFRKLRLSDLKSEVFLLSLLLSELKGVTLAAVFSLLSARGSPESTAIFFFHHATSSSGLIYVLRFQHITVNARDYYYDIRITTKIYADSHAGVRMAHLNRGDS